MSVPRITSAASVALSLAAVVVTLLMVLSPFFMGSGTQRGDSTTDPATVSHYQADFDVAADGLLTAKETITADFPAGRHGIFRFWDILDPLDDTVRLVPEDIGITMDGSSVPVEYSWENDRYRVAKVGDPERTLTPGEHTYVLTYTVKGALSPVDAGRGQVQSMSWASPDPQRSSFYWNLIPGGWSMPITKATLNVTVPADAQGLVCQINDAQDCRISGENTQNLTVEAENLPPNTPVTIRTELDTPAPDRRSAPWGLTWQNILGPSIPLVIGIAVVSVLALLLGWFLTARSRERAPGFPVMYSPPDHLAPGQLYFVMHETGPSQATIAALLHMAERRYIRLDQHGDKHWTVQSLLEPGQWSGVDPISRRIAERLRITEHGAVFSMNGTESAGNVVRHLNDDVKHTTSGWAFSNKLLERSSSESLGQALVVLVGLAGAAVIVFRIFGFTLAGVPLAAFAIGGIGLLRTGVGTRRTAQGRELWSKAGGFYRLLSTPSAQDRFDFAAHKDLYTAYIPYAVAFGCADEWAKKYEMAVGEPPPAPEWYPSYGYGHSYGYFSSPSSAFSSFESSLSSSIGAYEAAQAAKHDSSGSGGSGGGFTFSGGGGGGGGGGSW